MLELVDVTLALLMLAGITLTLLMLAGIAFALLLESYMQMIELASIILALLIEVLGGVIFAHLFEDTLAWICSSWSIRKLYCLA